jgi:hypothetical protein
MIMLSTEECGGWKDKGSMCGWVDVERPIRRMAVGRPKRIVTNGLVCGWVDVEATIRTIVHLDLSGMWVGFGGGTLAKSGKLAASRKVDGTTGLDEPPLHSTHREKGSVSKLDTRRGQRKRRPLCIVVCSLSYLTLSLLSLTYSIPHQSAI